MCCTVRSCTILTVPSHSTVDRSVGGRRSCLLSSFLACGVDIALVVDQGTVTRPFFCWRSLGAIGIWGFAQE